jgi:hypothetical protein
MAEPKKPWEGISPNERAIMNLANSGQTLGEQIDAYLKQREIDAVMRQVISDQRGGSIAQLPTTTIPQRPTSPPVSKGTGWRDDVPIDRPPGIATIDRMMDAQDAKDRAERVRDAMNILPFKEQK